MRRYSYLWVVFLALALALPFSAMSQTITLESLTTGHRIGGAPIKTFSFAPDGSLIVYLAGPLNWVNLDPPITLDSTGTACTVTPPGSVGAQLNATLSFTVRSVAGSTFTTGPISTGTGCSPAAPCSTVVDPDPGQTTFASTSGSGFGVFTWNTNGVPTGSYLAVFEASAPTGGTKSQLPVMITILPAITVTAPTSVTGPATGSLNTAYSFTASGSTSTQSGDTVQYQFDWGDGTKSPWASGTQSKTWTVAGTYTVKAWACSSTYPSVQSGWTTGPAIIISSTPPPPTGYQLTVSISPTGGGTVTVNGIRLFSPGTEPYKCYRQCNTGCKLYL